ncbi:MAG: homocysteine S-methyltransferase family protein [Spirochaetaceae bacterium]|nr:homocysteine S-methyltransferase family protein [Spirochaetaceae bacterium]
MNFREFLQEHIRNHEPVFFDGGMGTIIQTLQAKDKVPLVDFELKEEVHYHAPDELSITAPELIKAIHSAYLKAGANIITTNTFGATPIKLEDSSYKTEEIIEAAVRNAKEAIDKSGSKAFVALDVSSSGKLLEPMGPLTFDEAYENYKTTMIAGEKAGADLVLVETMSDLYETKAAVLAARENTNLPVIVSATFQNNLRTLTGADPLTAIVYLESMGVEAAGFNCGGSLADAAKITETMADYASVPLLVQPNAGLPVVENGKTIFKVKPEEFAEAQAANFKTGALILGGCCGTTPSHIQAMVKAVNKIKADKIERNHKLQNHTIVSSYNECVDIGSPENGPVIIGERINPTGKKKFKQALIDKNMQYIIDEASNQINAGAHILDVNVGLPGIDEQQMMVDSVKLLQSSFRIPLQIDSSEPPVLEKALRYYNGKALINSVNGKKHVMEAVFPIVKKYGGSVVALALDENGIPPTAEERLAIADLIFKTAESYGIPKRDIVIDSLTLTISSQQKEARETLRTIQLVKQKHGCKTVLGVSNISFGLPRREIINSHFFTQALAAGLDACIINPLSQDMMAAFRAFRAIAGFDANCLEYIENYANTVAPTVAAGDGKTASAAPVQKADASDLKSIIASGFKDRSAAAAQELLKTNSALDIINNHIVPALDEVGKDFESGRKFLPQLLLSAETVAKAFEVIKAHLAASGEAQESKGKIVIATVQGDVHDIGKNIVKAMLENYGYNVIDLGKDVPIESVVNAVRENDIKLVGLSALMTTTVASMEQTIKALREYEKETGKTVKIMVGGAVLTAEYAKKIDADYYAKDAMNSVEIAKEVFGA